MPLASTSHSPIAPKFSIHLAAPVTSLIPPLASNGQSTDEGAALILRLCNLHVPPADIARVIAVLSGGDESTIEEAQLLGRLHNLKVPPEDIVVIVDAMQRRRQSIGAPDDDASEAPPSYDSKEHQML
jgi:hypothetical protein